IQSRTTSLLQFPRLSSCVSKLYERDEGCLQGVHRKTARIQTAISSLASWSVEGAKGLCTSSTRAIDLKADATLFVPKRSLALVCASGSIEAGTTSSLTWSYAVRFTKRSTGTG